MKCPNCGAEVPEGVKFCSQCSTSLTSPAPAAEPAAPVAPAPEAAPQPASKPKLQPKKLIPIAAIAAAVVVVMVLISLLGGSNPVKAAANLLEVGNFTAVIRADSERINLQVDIDYKTETLTVYAEQNGDFLFAIYDGYCIVENYDYWDYETYYHAEDFSQQIQDFFDSLDSSETISTDELTEALEDMLGEDAQYYLDMEQLEKCLKDYGKKFTSKRWLEKNAGYSVYREDGVKFYCLEPDLYDFLTASLAVFEKAFVDDYDYDMVLEELDAMRDELSELELSFALGVKGKYLTSCEIIVDEGYGPERMKITFRDIGDTEIDTQQLETILSGAQK